MEGDKRLNKRQLSLLIFALKIGWQVIENSRHYFEYCEDARNDYFQMTEILSELTGENLDEATD